MDFTANASHELRTPLAVIQAQTSLALSQPRDEDWYQRAFTRVNQESQRMRRLVDDLLWLARFEAMPRSGRAEPVDVGVMAQQAVDRFAAVAEARQQRLSVRLSGDSHVIAAAPDIIVGSWCGKKFVPAKVAARDGFAEVPAVRRRWLREIKSTLILQPGPAALTDGLDALVAIIDEWQKENG